MGDSFLNQIELDDLTGYKLAKFKARWLTENGIVCFINAEGHVKATWWAVNHPQEQVKCTTEPDFDNVA